MSASKQLSQDLDIAAGDVCVQSSAKGDYQDEAHFLATVQPMFDAAARSNRVVFSALVVDVLNVQSLDGEYRDIYRATATASAP